MPPSARTHTFHNKEEVLKCPKCGSPEMEADVEIELDEDSRLLVSLSVHCDACGNSVQL